MTSDVINDVMKTTHFFEWCFAVGGVNEDETVRLFYKKFSHGRKLSTSACYVKSYENVKGVVRSKISCGHVQVERLERHFFLPDQNLGGPIQLTEKMNLADLKCQAKLADQWRRRAINQSDTSTSRGNVLTTSEQAQLSASDAKCQTATLAVTC